MNRSDKLRAQRGAITFKGILSLAVLILLAHTAYVFIPVYIAVYDFNSQVEKEANFGSVKTNEAIEKSLLDYAKARKIPVAKNQLKVQRGIDRLTITADYTMVVPTLLYRYEWLVTTEESGVLF